jgi:hypothetical protein
MIAIKCDECDSAGFIYFGNSEEYSVMKCDCNDLTLDWND